MATINAYPSSVRADGTSLLVFQGTPNRTINWSFTGSGSLTPLSNYTDALGRAGAVYEPGDVGDLITVEVTAGA